MLDKLKKIIIRTLAVIVAVLFLFFAMVNREVVTLATTPFPFVIEMRLFLFTALLLLLGIFIGWVVASFECRRRYLVQKATRKRLEALEDEVTALRARHHLPDTPVYERPLAAAETDTASS